VFAKRGLLSRDQGVAARHRVFQRRAPGERGGFVFPTDDSGEGREIGLLDDGGQCI
jgi:hypothetical protein